MSKQDLIEKIKDLKSQLEPLEKELRVFYEQEAHEVNDRLELALKKQAKFNADELIFAAHSRCNCGAGWAYPKNIGMHGAWHCSSILLGTAEKGSLHDAPLPFSFYEIKSENQPSAKGATTRPKTQE